VENFLRLKAYYLPRGPLAGRDAVIIWGAGMMGGRLGKLLLHQQAPLAAFIDIDPHKIGHTRHGLPVLSPEELPAIWNRYTHPALLAVVGVRGARELIRRRMAPFDLIEGRDWWCAA
jgi:FlaA1/EpsC-like NDP-sugar epimerase